MPSLFLYLDKVLQTAPRAGVVLAFDDILYLVRYVAEEVYTCEVFKEINAAYFCLAIAVYMLEEQTDTLV